MRHTELKSCDLSGNVITKIPPKFAVKFNLITGKEKRHENHVFLEFYSTKKKIFIFRTELITQPNGKVT